MNSRLTRRALLQGTAGLMAARAPAVSAAERPPARIAITFDLEMSRNFPQWEDTHWDYEKGNLNEETKRYSVEAARRVKRAGGVVHFFAVGRVFEQKNVDWLREIVEQGHAVGNHTYDHVNVRAESLEEVQYRFRRSPWLARGRSPQELIRENIRLCELAMRRRLGVAPSGFRTPGGFADGLQDHAGVRAMLRELGYTWVSSKYPPHPRSEPMERPSEAVLKGIVAAQAAAQPAVYEDGLVEIPMSPVSDINAFRTCRWQLPWFVEAVRRSVQWAIDNGAVFDFLAHPSCMYVMDPKFETVEMICEMVAAAGDKASLVDLDTIARQFR